MGKGEKVKWADVFVDSKVKQGGRRKKNWGPTKGSRVSLTSGLDLKCPLKSWPWNRLACCCTEALTWAT
jgi:hypothetical protein